MARSSLPAVSDLFEGRYRLVRVLGEGGFAVVYEARDEHSRTTVAVKILRPEAKGGYNPADVTRARRELDALQRVHSPHVVRLHSYGVTASGLVFMVFEHLQGRELADVLDEEGTLPEVTVKHILKQLLEALDETHRLGILHRDIKPENVMVVPRRDDPWAIKLIDFGIARATDQGSPSVTRTGELIGTPRYMSPEQLTNRPLSAASDVYSVGLVAYEMLMGRDALHGASWGAQLERMRAEHRFEVQGAGPLLSTAIERMTARAEDRRVQTCAAALKLLQPAPTGQRPHTVLAAPLGRRRQAVLAALAFGTCVGLLATIYFGKSREPPSPIPVRPPPVVMVPSPSRVSDASTDMHIDMGPAWLSLGCDRDLPTETPHVWAPLPRTNDPLPVVVLLHDHETTAQDLSAAGGFREIASRQPLIVYAPPAPGLRRRTNWEQTTQQLVDLEPLDSVVRGIEEIMDRHCVDARRIYVVGHGSAGVGAERLRCRIPLAGIATVQALGAEPQKYCDPSPVPMLRIRMRDGGHDPPFGGAPCGRPGTVQRTLNMVDDAWAVALDCSTDDPRFRADETGDHSRTWQCDGFILQSELLGGGYGWPGVRRTGEPLACLGSERPYGYAERVWTFFEANWQQTTATP